MDWNRQSEGHAGHPTAHAAPVGVKPWLVLSAGASCAGWLLSAAGSLNAASYAVLGVAFVLWMGLRARRSGVRWQEGWQKLRRRFRRPLPFAFLLLAGLALIGGALYAPTNYDALAYRLPRVLHWLAEGRWHWIHTDFPRLNVRACGSEWLLAPLLALTRSDRLLFLPNIVSFLLLPGLIFSVFTRLGVARRVAWQWMWLLPSGYCFALQAGGIANDLTAAPYALAAVDLALRARASRDPRLAAWSLIAAALLTGAKASNGPLLLPWAVLIFGTLPQLFRRPLLIAGASLIAALASFLPTAILNFSHTGDWTGVRAEGLVMGQPVRRAVANGLIFAGHNLTPPVFPTSGWWNAHVASRFPVPSQGAGLEPFKLREMQAEEDAGLGMGVCMLLGAASISALFCRPPAKPSRPRGVITLALWTPWAALGVFAATAPVFGSAARLITPYYALLILPCLLLPGQRAVVRQRWWGLGVCGVLALAAAVLIATPARPLWPAQTGLSALREKFPAQALLARAETVYATYRVRADGFAPAVALLPADERVVGLIAFDDPETSLWKPFGRRRWVHVVPGDTAQTLQARGVRHILIKPRIFESSFHQPLPAWLAANRAAIFETIQLKLRANEPPDEWVLARFD
jgi:hypothetical protein